MSKSLAASKDLMQNYLSELLTEDAVESPLKESSNKEETHKLNKLLQSVNATERKQDIAPAIVSKKSADISETPVYHPEPITDTIIETKKSLDEAPVVDAPNYRSEAFQAMFFDVAGLIVAVPLIELGGIHNLEPITSLVGKPKWFEGVMLHRDKKINVVDTAQWVMPEKYNDELKEGLDYQYVIMLGNSQWGLLAEHLVDTVTLQPEDVKWLDSSTKRPWLAGLVKDRMCALLEVESLIKLLNDGIDVHLT